MYRYTITFIQKQQSLLSCTKCSLDVSGELYLQQIQHVVSAAKFAVQTAADASSLVTKESRRPSVIPALLGLPCCLHHSKTNGRQ